MPTPAAIRMQRLRKRQREGAVHIRLDVPAAVVERLIDAGHLAEWDAYDPEKLGAALLESVWREK